MKVSSDCVCLFAAHSQDLEQYMAHRKFLINIKRKGEREGSRDGGEANWFSP